MAKPNTPQFYARLTKLRQKRIEKRAGKALIHEEREILEYVDRQQVPVMIQHCVLKVIKKMPGDDKEAFISAFNICSATFSINGYTQDASMKMTGAGIKRNRRHQREKEAGSKKARYSGLVRKIWAASIKRMKMKAPVSEQTTVQQKILARGKPQAQAPKLNMNSRRAARKKRK